MYAQLGSIVFEGLRSPTEFGGSHAASLAEHARIEGKPRLQKTGNQLQTRNLSLTLHASFCSPESVFASLVEACDASTIMPYILGNGIYVGDFVIETLDHDIIHADPIGNVVHMVVSVKLKESYDVDRAGRLAQQARQGAYATASAGASPLRIVTPPRPSLGTTAGQDLKDIRLESKAIDLNVTKAKAQPGRWATLGTKISASLDKIEKSSQQFQSKIIDPALSPFAGETAQALLGVYSSVQNMRTALPITDINSLQNFNNGLQGSTRYLNQTSTVFTGALATRRI